MASLSGCMIGWIFSEIDIINPDENCWDGRRLWCADTSPAMAINILVSRSATPVVPVTMVPLEPGAVALPVPAAVVPLVSPA